MPRLTKRDRALMAVLLPLFVVVFSLHVREVVRTGFAQPPVFAVPGADSEAYPRVGGLRLERGIRWNGLEVGDTLIRIGEVDLRGVGYAGFDAITMEQTGLERVAPLVLERDGERREIELRVVPHARPWFRVPFLLSFVLVSLLILLRAPGSRQAQAIFAGFTTFAIAECHFFGGPRLQSYISIYLFNFGGAVAVYLMLRWLIHFPQEVPDRDRLSVRWAWLAVLWIVVRLNYFLGGPIAPENTPGAVLTVDAFFGVLGLSITTWNYLHANRIGRRRFKWLVFGGYVATIPWLASALASYLGLPRFRFHEMFEVYMLMQVAFPIGILIAIVRFNLLDIDRLLSATASYTLAVAVLAGLTFSAIPVVVENLAEQTGWSEAALHPAIAISLVGLGLFSGRRIRPWIDRRFFPEREALRLGIGRLLADLARCRSSEEVISLVHRRVAAATNASHATLFERSVRGLEARPESGRSTSIHLPLDSPLVRGLAANPQPREANEEERRLLSPLDVRLLLPIRSGIDLAAIIAVGEKQSGDIYTRMEISMLASVCERASAELLRMRDEAALVNERVRGDELEDQKRQAEDTNLSRSRFLAAASHDLRQPLHAMGLLASALSDRLGEEDAPDLVRRIQSSTESLSEMLDALLDMSRLDAGAVDPAISEFELGPIVERLVSEFEPSADAKGLSLVASTVQERVRSDPVLLGRILQNLVTNAIRYTDRGSVTIRCIRGENDVRIEIVDTGCGIPEDCQQTVFLEFNRVESRSGEGGLGLGLSIVQRMSELLDHPIGLESSPEAGSTFAVTVPRAESAVPQPVAPRIDFRGRRLLVIDDDLAVLDATGRLLREWGCDVRLAATLEEAAEACAGAGAFRPDAILADYRLGDGVTGLEAVKRLNQTFDRPVPSVVITGETTRDVLDEIRAQGLMHLAKPVPPFKLRATLMELLRT